MKTFLIFLSGLIIGVIAGYLFGYDIGNLSRSINITPAISPSEPPRKAFKDDLIKVESPTINQKIVSPFTVKGEARGKWFFEASFPVYLSDGNGSELAVGVAQAKGEWMTEKYVPFEVTISFANPGTPGGELVLKKDNPSGLPEHDDELRIPVKFDI